MNFFNIFLMYLLVMSFMTYIAYTNDKRKAKKGKYRIKEYTLLMMSFLGGALGGIFAMYLARHKNKKILFIFVNFMSLLIHIIILYIFFVKIK